MNPDIALDLLGGLSPNAFMKKHWQRKPLLVRRAIPGFRPALSIAEVRELVRREEVESRLIWQDDGQWKMRSGPFARLPSMRRAGWTVLAQNTDAHDDGMAGLLHRFRFIPDARLDDAMISVASDGGGVGPHFDSYDVFLLQAHGRRRWRISAQQDLSLEEGLPLKILRHFRPEHEYVLEPGDMLYLPPHIAHDGVAEGDCMTISIGFRAPTLATLARGVLEAAGDQLMARIGEDAGLYGARPAAGPKLDKRYGDGGSTATRHPARLPDDLVQATLDAALQIKFNEALASRFLGQWLTEPSSAAWFEPSGAGLDLAEAWPLDGVLVPDRCTRLMYRGNDFYINGELAELPASPALRALADDRRLECDSRQGRRLKPGELDMLGDWLAQGWLHHERGR
ncbi:cupin domain-containing protein [Pusillimonas noertemannii]|uniref:50S ribosomal protein L16 3-hydroxylase n=1 Tax=Pusillimonas noertemannii TaxID=305977 RepID=A0A2U1CLC8_9BURK|nr:cupin domain-containing protein [Pusillimonas noertemannii]NYT69354.1 cupin domain-containing protein [Pusillimonas noertemannii]PVY61820.1 50S ribosomal protein L16 3-hydroxylase [Pusillimonas noertemannii]TFL09752.1 cupin domain-containing protein [Pusillimonas noertemannii]